MAHKNAKEVDFRDSDLLEIIEEEWGNLDELAEQAVFGAVAIGACSHCGNTSEPHEPDATENWCSICGANNVKSILTLLGM